MFYMTIEELIKDKDYDFIELRVFDPELHMSVFIGSAKSINGDLLSLDGDIYRKESEILEYEEWSGKKVKNAVTIMGRSL